MIVNVNLSGFKAKEINIDADSDNGVVKLNDNIISFDANEFINKLQDIVKSWEPQMVNPRILDGSWYSVKIQDGISEKIFVGRNKFPANYNSFLELIDGVKNAPIKKTN